MSSDSISILRNRVRAGDMHPKSWRLCLAAVMVLWPTSQSAEARAAVPLVAAGECTGLADHATERACWEALARTTTAEVAGTQRTVLSQLDRWDQGQDYRRRTRALLLASFRQFASFRAAQCEAEASLAAGGNGAGDVRLSCEVRLNRGRVAELQSVGAGFE